MKKATLAEYLKSPCSAASIPYWKQKNIRIPANIKILHDRDYVKGDFTNYIDEPYFRLYHDLKLIEKVDAYNVEIIEATSDLLNEFVEIINASYFDISISNKQIEKAIKSPVYCPGLWILLKDRVTDNFVGCGIADYDKNIGEVILEWIQVLPKYRRRGYGSIIVNYLLDKMQGKAKFATVSGKKSNPTNPESLYRKCGFTGDDVWHILHKK